MTIQLEGQKGRATMHASGATSQTATAALIKAAAEIGPEIRALGRQIEKEQRLPPAIVETLRKLGYFSLWLPRELGGLELTLSDYARVIEALARYDASVAWCASQASNFSFMAGILPVPVARRIFVDDKGSIAGNMRAQGKALQVEGGYRVSGRWAYASGIGHCTWILGGCLVYDGDEPRLRPNGSHVATIALFPAREIQVLDTWDVGGLRGTGSHDYQVDDLFVPEEYALTRWSPSRPETLYAVPFPTTGPVAIAAVPLGIARAALDELREMTSSKTPLISSVPLREKPVVQAAIGRAESTLRAGRAFLLEACDDAWRTVASGAHLEPEQRALVRLAAAHAAEAARLVMQTAYELGGGTSVYESCPLQRWSRDMNTAVQHVQVHTGNFETCGRVLLGLEAGTYLL